MDKKEWRSNSIEDRLKWYKNEIDSLFDFLVEKEPFEEDAVQAKSIQALQDAKKIMQFDLEQDEEYKREHSEYYKAVDEAYNQLPKPSEHRQEWFEKLGNVKNTLAGLK